VTASNPKKERHNIAAPANTIELEPSGFINGIVEKRVPAPSPLKRPFTERITKATTNIIWNEIARPNKTTGNNVKTFLNSPLKFITLTFSSDFYTLSNISFYPLFFEGL